MRKPPLSYAIPVIFLLCLQFTAAAQEIDPDAISLKKGIKMNGGIGLSSVYYHSNQVRSYPRDPFNWFATGSLNFNLYGIDAPFSFSYSNARAQYAQPFNRLRFMPKYKWVRLYLGSGSMQFSNYTLAGYTFKGYGVELTPGKFKFKAMYGALKEAIPYNFVDTTNNTNVSYKRKAMGFNLGYSDKGNVYEISVFKAKDDTSSLSYVPPQYPLFPQSNLSASLLIRQKLGSKFSADAEYAVSALTGNVNDKESGTAGYPGSIAAGILKPFFKGNNTTRYYDAVTAGIGYNEKNYGLQVRYERVAPGYMTLGAYYMNNDLENITIAPSVRLFNSRLNLNGNAGIQHDNLDKSKTSTTRRFVGNVNLSYVAGRQWMLNLAYSNFNTYTKVRPVATPFFQNGLDSLNFYQVSQSASANINHSFGSSTHPQNLNLNLSYQRAANQSNTDTVSQLSNFFTSNLAYAYSIPKQGLVLAAAANYYNNNAPGISSSFYGPTLSLGHKIWKQVTSTWAATYNRNTVNSIPAPAITTGRWNLSYYPRKAGNAGAGNSHPDNGIKGKQITKGTHTITSSLGYTHRGSNAAMAPYDEWLWNISYNYNF